MQIRIDSVFEIEISEIKIILNSLKHYRKVFKRNIILSNLDLNSDLHDLRDDLSSEFVFSDNP